MQRGINARRRSIAVATALATSTIAIGLTGCSSGGEGGDTVIRVVYPEQSPSTVRSDVGEVAAEAFEASHPGWTVELVPLNAVDDDYLTKMTLMQSSASTAPDVVMVDSFVVNAQVGAGYLAPIDEQLGGWADWDAQFSATARNLAVAVDGKTYGVPITGGTIGLWYDKSIFEAAGLPTDFAPETWDDVIAAAEAIKATSPGVVPFAAMSTAASGEGTTMQTVETLLQGTDGGLDATLYDTASQEWVTGSEGFVQALSFLDEIRTKELGGSQAQILDPNYGGLFGDWFKGDQVGMALSGSWISGAWAEWPEWKDELGWTAMPTIDGGGAGRTSMTGGWVWSVAGSATDVDAAFDFVTLLTDYDNTLALVQGTGDLPTRNDVANAPELQDNPAVPFFYDLVTVAGIRPGLEVYPQISSAIQDAAEAVSTGAMTPEEAAIAYDEAVKRIVGN